MLENLESYKIGKRSRLAYRQSPRQPYFKDRDYRISGELTNTDHHEQRFLDRRLSRIE